MSDPEPKPLDEPTQAKWDVIKKSMFDLAGAMVDGDLDGAQALMNQAKAVELVNLAQIRDALHIPDDAGEYREQLVAMLKRIPSGWGRWISCKRGWYPLLVDLDEQLRAIDPDYQIQQVKEKYGTLRFYAEPSRDLPCCQAWERLHPRPDPEDEAAWDAWGALQDEHVDTDDHRAEDAKWSERAGRFRAAINQAEAKSSRICEETGGIGCLVVSEMGWYRTIDPLLSRPGEMPARSSGWTEWELNHAGDDPEKLRKMVGYLIEQRDHRTDLLEHMLKAHQSQPADDE